MLNSGSPMVSATGLNKKFGPFQALNNINFSVNHGEVIALIGPSGAGKSTLLRSLNLLVKPDSGQLSIGDQTINARQLTRRRITRFRRQTAMVFQHYNVFRNKTALENITEVLIYGRGFSRSAARERAMDLLERVDLAQQADAYPATLSGGQLQRVGIARAMSLEPAVLLLDEPTSSLDPALRRDVLRLIARLAEQGCTMLMATHEMGFAREMSHRIMLMEKGKIVEQGEPEQMIRAVHEHRSFRLIHPSR